MFVLKRMISSRAEEEEGYKCLTIIVMSVCVCVWASATEVLAQLESVQVSGRSGWEQVQLGPAHWINKSNRGDGRGVQQTE